MANVTLLILGASGDLSSRLLLPALGQLLSRETDRRIRRDFARFAAGAPPAAELRAAAGRLGTLDLPALVVWADKDRLMPADHGPRLAELLRAELVVVEDSSTLIPED